MMVWVGALPPTRLEEVVHVPTIMDVARLAQVSRSTASRVLNGYTGTPAAVRERVLAAARALGYEPDAAARGLARGRTENIGVVVADVGDPFFAPFLRGAGEAAAAAGYSLTITSGDWAREEAAFFRLVRQRRADGLLFISGRELSPGLAEALRQCELPMVMVDRDEDEWDLPIDRVDANNREAMADLVQWLFSQGHERIAFVGGPGDLPAAVRRLEGYRLGLERSGLTFRPELVIPGDLRLSGGQQALGVIASQNPRPTAVIAANDLMAIGILKAASAARIRVPDDLSVVGVDDIPAASWVTPELTTLHQPCYEMGRRGVELLLARIGERQAKVPAAGDGEREPAGHTGPRHEWIPFRLVVRASVRPVKDSKTRRP